MTLEQHDHTHTEWRVLDNRSRIVHGPTNREPSAAFLWDEMVPDDAPHHIQTRLVEEWA